MEYFYPRKRWWGRARASMRPGYCDAQLSPSAIGSWRRALPNPSKITPFMGLNYYIRAMEPRVASRANEDVLCHSHGNTSQTRYLYRGKSVE